MWTANDIYFWWEKYNIKFPSKTETQEFLRSKCRWARPFSNGIRFKLSKDEINTCVAACPASGCYPAHAPVRARMHINKCTRAHACARPVHTHMHVHPYMHILTHTQMHTVVWSGRCGCVRERDSKKLLDN